MAQLSTPRTFLRRRGRITRGQARALGEGFGKLALPVPESPLDWNDVFGRSAPLLLEIGFGMGEGLLEVARVERDWNCLGVDVYRPGIGAVILRCEAEGLTNVRLIEGDARALLANGIAEGTLLRVILHFPDPWPKKRHHKRRLVEPGFAALLASRMAPGAQLFAATDWEPYAHQMLSVFDAEPKLENSAGTGRFAPPAPREPTRFEARGRRLGHPIFDLAYERTAL